MEASGKEKQISRVACLLDELNGKEFSGNSWDGYHPEIYSKGVDGDSLVIDLCRRLQSVDVTKYSLEMQIWWRDHQKSDRERLEKEVAEQATKTAKEQALSKLTDYERELLRLYWGSR
jgi:hypothetical protein